MESRTAIQLLLFRFQGTIVHVCVFWDDWACDITSSLLANICAYKCPVCYILKMLVQNFQINLPLAFHRKFLYSWLSLFLVSFSHVINIMLIKFPLIGKHYRKKNLNSRGNITFTVKLLRVQTVWFFVYSGNTSRNDTQKQTPINEQLHNHKTYLEKSSQQLGLLNLINQRTTT